MHFRLLFSLCCLDLVFGVCAPMPAITNAVTNAVTKPCASCTSCVTTNEAYGDEFAFTFTETEDWRPHVSSLQAKEAPAGQPEPS